MNASEEPKAWPRHGSISPSETFNSFLILFQTMLPPIILGFPSIRNILFVEITMTCEEIRHHFLRQGEISSLAVGTHIFRHGLMFCSLTPSMTVCARRPLKR